MIGIERGVDHVADRPIRRQDLDRLEDLATPVRGGGVDDEDALLAHLSHDVALRAGAKLVIINLMPTPFDGDANLLINCKIGEFASLALQVIESSTLS